MLSDRNIFCPLGGGEKRRGPMPLGRFLFFIFGGHLPHTPSFRSAKEIVVVSFATQPRAFILSDRNIFYTPRGGGERRRGLMPLGLFLFSLFSIFLVVTCPRPPVFARPNKYLSRLSLHSLGLVSWVAVIYFAP